MKLVKRSGIAAGVIVGAALIATGCGSSGGGSSDASSAAKDAAALDLVPKDAIGYATVNADVNGSDWKQFDDLAKGFDKNFDGVGNELAKSTKKGDHPV
ncbi:MAG: hypothetical protein JWM98_169, partial [Thermoleophilia bacterium]|nr:hypothetical protein [Thermoleophilia bacterium]